jgi:hypothetical protein
MPLGGRWLFCCRVMILLLLLRLLARAMRTEHHTKIRDVTTNLAPMYLEPSIVNAH